MDNLAGDHPAELPDSALFSLINRIRAPSNPATTEAGQIITARTKVNASKKFNIPTSHNLPEIKSARPEKTLCKTTNKGKARAETNAKSRYDFIFFHIWINAATSRRIPEINTMIAVILSLTPMRNAVLINTAERISSSNVVLRFIPLNNERMYAFMAIIYSFRKSGYDKDRQEFSESQVAIWD
ncbi:MAG TPA: hypothetical protein ENJ14_03925 [Bacteroidetes bacterium]|nr:hypothetical protein [Bacteroidota bacterium]